MLLLQSFQLYQQHTRRFRSIYHSGDSEFHGYGPEGYYVTLPLEVHAVRRFADLRIGEFSELENQRISETGTQFR